MSAVRDCLVNIFSATLRTRRTSSIRNLRTRHAVVTRDPPNIDVQWLQYREYRTENLAIHLTHSDQTYFKFLPIIT